MIYYICVNVCICSLIDSDSKSHWEMIPGLSGHTTLEKEKKRTLETVSTCSFSPPDFHFDSFDIHSVFHELFLNQIPYIHIYIVPPVSANSKYLCWGSFEPITQDTSSQWKRSDTRISDEILGLT